MFVGGGKGGHSALAGGSHLTWVAAAGRAQQDRAVPAQTTPVCRRKTQSQPHREMVPPQWVILADVLTHCHPSPQSPSSRDRTGCLRGLTALEHWKPWSPHHLPGRKISPARRAWERDQGARDGKAEALPWPRRKRQAGTAGGRPGRVTEGRRASTEEGRFSDQRNSPPGRQEHGVSSWHKVSTERSKIPLSVIRNVLNQ